MSSVRALREAISSPRMSVWTGRVASWAAITIATILNAHGLAERLTVGAFMVVAALAIQFTGDDRTLRVTTGAITLATVLGLGSVLLSPQGLGEVPVFVAASKIAFPLDRGWGLAYIVLDTVAVAATVAFVSRSFVGVLAGIGVPLLAQRAVERRALMASRDEARALLVEVQAGRDAESQAAALQERGRIARDLHDVLAHSLAGLSMQLQATRAIAARDQVGPAVLEPLDRAAELARDGLAEARAVVGALRDPGGLGLDEIPTLVRRQPGQAHLTITGAPADVPPAAGHALYRAVQEALTNSARYAPGSPVQVTVEHAPARVCVQVDDDGPAPGRTARPSQGTGLGLAGMGERVSAVGGRLTAGPRPDGGWRVQVEVALAATVSAAVAP